MRPFMTFKEHRAHMERMGKPKDEDMKSSKTKALRAIVKRLGGKNPNELKKMSIAERGRYFEKGEYKNK